MTVPDLGFIAMSICESQVTIRGFRTDDVSDFMVWATDDEVTEVLLWASYTSEKDALNFLINVAIPHPWLKAICIDGKAVGSIVLERGEGVDCCKATLGYCTAKMQWGKGVTTHAVEKIVQLGFQQLDIFRIEALVEKSNVASRRVLEKAGFQLEGTMHKYKLVKGKLRDYHLFARYAPEKHPSSHS